VDLNEPPADRYVCETCGDKKASRGCISPAENQLWKIEYCPLCGGKNEKCHICCGKGEISMLRCPRAIASFRLLPFFIEHYKSGAWPDGRGRLYQPIKLIMAFDILRGYYQRAAVNYGSKA
jgi:hypothetical protein